MSDGSPRTTAPEARVTQPLQPDKSLGELFGELTSDFGHLFRQEVELAKTEAKAEAKKAGKGVGMFAGAGLGAWMAVLFLSLALAWLLDQAMNTALAFALVGVLWAIVAAVLAKRGKKQIATAKPIPETVNTLKEDVQWAKTQNS